MALNRRTFLTRIAQGAAAAVVFAHVPMEWVPKIGGARRYVALEYLRTELNRFTRGLRMKDYPELMVVGRDLYEAAENEMVYATRDTLGIFVPTDMPFGRSIMFKGLALTYRGRGYRILYIGKMDRAQYDS